MWLTKRSQRTAILLVALQIITVLKANHDSMEGAIEMAEPYATYLSIVSVVDLDFASLLPLSCITASHVDHFDMLLVTTLVPLGVLFVFGCFRHLLKRERKKAVTQHLIQVLFL